MIKYTQKRVSAEEWCEVVAKVMHELKKSGLEMTPNYEAVILATINTARKELMENKIVRITCEENEKIETAYCLGLLDIMQKAKEEETC